MGLTLRKEHSAALGLLHKQLADRCSGSLSKPGGDTIIVVQLHPSFDPPVIRILRSEWPTSTALNYSEGKEFHVRLRRHRSTGIFLLYGSVTDPQRPHTVIQRGVLCKTIDDAKDLVFWLRQELGLKPEGKLFER